MVGAVDSVWSELRGCGKPARSVELDVDNYIVVTTRCWGTVDPPATPGQPHVTPRFALPTTQPHVVAITAGQRIGAGEKCWAARARAGGFLGVSAPSWDTMQVWMTGDTRLYGAPRDCCWPRWWRCWPGVGWWPWPWPRGGSCVPGPVRGGCWPPGVWGPRSRCTPPACCCSARGATQLPRPHAPLHDTAADLRTRELSTGRHAGVARLRLG